MRGVFLPTFLGKKKTLVQSRARNDSGVLGVGHVTGASGDNLQAGEISALLA